MKAVTAAGGVLFRDLEDYSTPQVGVIFRRGVWDLPKGKQEEGESVAECAVREVAEELGLSSHPEILGQLSDTYHEYERAGIQYGKTTHWFVMTMTNDSTEKRFRPQSEEGIDKAEWIDLDEAISRVGYQNLVEVLTSFSNWYFTSQG